MGSARSLRQGTDRCWRRSARSATPLPRRRLDTIDTTGRHARGPVRVSSRPHPIYRNNLHVPTVVGNSFRETSAHGGTVYLRRWCGVAGLRREHPGGHCRASEQTPNDVRLPMASSVSVASLGPGRQCPAQHLSVAAHVNALRGSLHLGCVGQRSSAPAPVWRRRQRLSLRDFAWASVVHRHPMLRGLPDRGCRARLECRIPDFDARRGAITCGHRLCRSA